MHLKFIPLVCLILFSTACRSAAPTINSGTTAAPVPAQPRIEPLPAQKTWKLIPVTSSRQYGATSISSLELNGVRDSLISETRLTLNNQPGDTTIIFSGTIDSLSAVTSSRIGRTDFPRVPIAFAGHLDRNSIVLATPSGCGDDHIPLELLIPHLLFQLPRQQFSAGNTWSDSTRISTCSGSIPLTTIVIQSFRVMGESIIAGRATILLNRTDHTSSTGNGAQGQHLVAIETRSNGSAELWIDSANGQLLKSTSQTTGTIAITASGRQQVFNQTTRTVIVSQ